MNRFSLLHSGVVVIGTCNRNLYAHQVQHSFKSGDPLQCNTINLCTELFALEKAQHRLIEVMQIYILIKLSFMLITYERRTDLTVYLYKVQYYSN